jgi:hypothetical protein
MALVVNRQRFGGSKRDNEAISAALAPSRFTVEPGRTYGTVMLTLLYKQGLVMSSASVSSAEDKSSSFYTRKTGKPPAVLEYLGSDFGRRSSSLFTGIFRRNQLSCIMRRAPCLTQTCALLPEDKPA